MSGAGGTNETRPIGRGSQYQRTLLYNSHLPYSELLEDEGNELFEQIKSNLSAAVQKSELWPGALYWTNRLASFLRMYNLQMSKKDHINLVKLMYSLVTIPNLESPLLQSWGFLLVKLLKKWKLLSREDLVLPWRPMQQLIEQVFFSKYKALGMNIYSSHAQAAVRHVVSHARVYFPVEATQEILDEWQPYLCPFDLSMVDALSYLELLLPTLLPPELHHDGFRLWFDKLIKFWLEPHIPTTADELLIRLFVRLAKHNIGHIDWSLYMSQIFNCVLRSFQLPVGPKEFQNYHPKEYFDAPKAASLIVSMLGGESAAQLQLATLMKALDSFYHPSNLGRHTKKLLIFLRELTIQFLLRLKREHGNDCKWYEFTPEHVCLTEKDVDEFVGCLLPATRMAIFSKFFSLDPAIALHNLALLRPEVVLPDLMERTYTALETLTEPHQVVATLQCVAAVSRVLMSGGMGRYPEGRNHLFSLLTLALPGIDPNDYRKTLMSGLVISALVTVVPLVDCSSAVDCIKMSEADKELCLLTGQFEDFVLQFLDRCFALVEYTSLEQVATLDRMVSAVSSENHESIMGMGTAGTLHSVLIQCSPDIFQVALEKLFYFATSHVFESEVSGKMCADMCSAAAKVDSMKTLKLFVPSCVRVIMSILEDPEQCVTEHPDNNLVWNIQLLSQVLHGQGNALLPHADSIISCLKKCVHLKCKTAASHAASALSNTLHCLTMTYPTESRSIASDFSSAAEDHLYINDWAVPGNFQKLGMQWHIPSDEELQLVDRLLEEFLAPEMECLKASFTGESMNRDSLNQSLQLILHILLGSAAYLPMWKGNQVDGCPTSVVNMERKDFICSAETYSPPEGFSRENLAKFVHELTEYILQHHEDDTKSQVSLVEILKVLLIYFGVHRKDFDGRWKAFMHSKLAFEDKLHGKKQHIRPMMIARIHLQHETRILERSMSTTTDLHLSLLKDLFRMSVSAYAEVRIKAQTAFGACVETYLYSGRKFFPDILHFILNQGNTTHEQLKGALHVLLLPAVSNVFLHDWELLSKTLKCIVQANPSEKPSILNLIHRVVKTIQIRYEYFTLQWTVPQLSIDGAATLCSVVNDDERVQGKMRTNTLNQKSFRIYLEAVEALVSLLEDGKLQWRHSQIGATFLLVLVRHDHPFPVPGVKLMVTYLIHDTLAMRKVSIAAMNLILQQQKRKHVKIPVDVAKEAGVIPSSNPQPGERDDINWLCYDSGRAPQTKEQYRTFTFVDKTHWGFYCWPKTLYTYAPYECQPPLNRVPKCLSESELAIHEAFSSPEFVSKLMSFLSLEEHKGKDQFDTYRFSLFKGLFRNFGSIFLHCFKPHLETLAVDSQESYQRCACEILAGMISGSKLWNADMVMELRSFVEPLFNKILKCVTPETIEDWAACVTNISANRDPNRLGWLLELLVINPLSGNSGSFIDASQLYLLQATMAQQEWRLPTLQHTLLHYLQPHLVHSFKNVRERIGSVLAQMFLYDTNITCVKFNPVRRDFLMKILQYIPKSADLTSLDRNGDQIKICKTGLQWLISSYQHSDPDMFHLLVKLLPLLTIDDDRDITQLMEVACAKVSHSELSFESVPLVLSYLSQAIHSGLLRVAIPALQILQKLVFGNLFTFTNMASNITQLLIELTESVQIELRELAASTLSGLIRCGYITNIDALKITFFDRAHTKIPRKKLDLTYEDLLVKRHSGVLGLAALVEACPYTVPDWLPDILSEMAQNLHGPMAIQATVRKTMSEFRRTHHDSWSEHKQKFSDDQLAILADLLVSPSYYA